MGFDLNMLFAFLLIIFLVWLASRILLKPLRLLMRILYNSLIGLVLLLVINFLGSYIGVFIPINIVTVLVAGFLGIPGIILLLILQFVVN